MHCPAAAEIVDVVHAAKSHGLVQESGRPSLKNQMCLQRHPIRGRLGEDLGGGAEMPVVATVDSAAGDVLLSVWFLLSQVALLRQSDAWKLSELQHPFIYLEEDLLSRQWRLAVLFVQAMPCVLNAKIACRKSLVTLGFPPSALFAGLICSHRGQIERLRIIRRWLEIVIADCILTRLGVVKELIHDKLCPSKVSQSIRMKLCLVEPGCQGTVKFVDHMSSMKVLRGCGVR